MSFAGTSISATGHITECTKLLVLAINLTETGAEKSHRGGTQRFWRGCPYRSRQRWTEVRMMSHEEVVVVWMVVVVGIICLMLRQ